MSILLNFSHFTLFFFFNDTATTEIYTVMNTLSLHDALPISRRCGHGGRATGQPADGGERSEEHTSELQSLITISYAVFCLKKKKKQTPNPTSSRARCSYHHRPCPRPR